MGLAKRGQDPFAGTARRVLRTKGSCPLFTKRDSRFHEQLPHGVQSPMAVAEHGVQRSPECFCDFGK